MYFKVAVVDSHQRQIPLPLEEHQTMHKLWLHVRQLVWLLTPDVLLLTLIPQQQQNATFTLMRLVPSKPKQGLASHTIPGRPQVGQNMHKPKG